ncbi:MAG: 16S rRNA (cytosine(1402)-N(4))-methyltransferase RsmH [Candidatus Sungbacteria bacterium]|nr:16S rRNA (cytosine(1402)-N(4))-methyltransferase RsmH [Candidatus Sungbacteria bacterium]
MADVHTPVFLNEVLEIFDPQPGQVYVDATVNGGGHARALADRIERTGRVIGIDLDRELIEDLRARNEQESRKNIELVHGNYADLGAILKRLGSDKVNSRCNVGVDGILFDLGFSSYHVDQSGRGFSFLRDEPLDMRYDPTRNELTADKIINTWSEQAIENLLRTCGQERHSRRIASRIVAERKNKRIATAAVLAEIIRSSIPHKSLTRIHPATRTFQALRMAVNDELGNIERGIWAAIEKLRGGGKIIAISFHSLEDRSIKLFFQKLRKEQVLEVLTPKPLKPSIREMTINPRARSAKLRAARKIG